VAGASVHAGLSVGLSAAKAGRRSPEPVGRCGALEGSERRPHRAQAQDDCTPVERRGTAQHGAARAWRPFEAVGL
jgi:hypothetical protein